MAADAPVAVGAQGLGWFAAHAIGRANEIPLALMLLGLVTWPLSIAARRGYDATNIGVNNHELTSLPRALADHIVLSGFVWVLTGSTSLLTRMVVATPVAVVLGIVARLTFRRTLHRRQRAGEFLRSVLVIGPLTESKDLSQTLMSDPACGLDVVGACVPESDLPEHHDPGLRVSGSLNEVPDVVARLRCETVAVTGGLSPCCLRGLACRSKGLVPICSCTPDSRWPVRGCTSPLVGLPLLHVEQPHLTAVVSNADPLRDNDHRSTATSS